MAVTVVLQLNMKPEARDEVVGSFKSVLPDTRAYDGCLGLRVFEDQDDRNHIVLIEQWESKEHYEKYVAWRTETGFMDQMGEALTSEPSFLYLDGIGA